MTLATSLLSFYKNLQPPLHLPNDVEWLYPQKDEEVMKVVESFLSKYYNDKKGRKLILGINPGRFGAGVTGVNFTAPKQLTQNLQIEHHIKFQTELSAEFIYKMIDAYGSAERFYSQFFISSVCPLGFVKKGKNINYYDDKELAIAVTPFIIQSLEEHLQFPFNTKKCFCLGGEKNFKFLSSLNEKYHWFDTIVPLPHPRFIMQYRRKQVDNFIQLYLDELKKD